MVLMGNQNTGLTDLIDDIHESNRAKEIEDLKKTKVGRWQLHNWTRVNPENPGEKRLELLLLNTMNGDVYWKMKNLWSPLMDISIEKRLDALKHFEERKNK